LVELHGGSVEARSDGPGRGSEFDVRLPLVIEAVRGPDRRGDEGTATATGQPRRVLVADDNADAAESLALVLTTMGHEVRIARDGQAAVGEVEAFRPEVALLDIGMPRLNGYEAARRIRQLPDGSGIVLAALTGWGQEDDKRKALEAGFVRHFTKPVDPEVLAQFLSEAAARVPG
jgi:CheY-like chemotaxis protein